MKQGIKCFFGFHKFEEVTVCLQENVTILLRRNKSLTIL